MISATTSQKDTIVTYHLPGMDVGGNELTRKISKAKQKRCGFCGILVRLDL